MTVTNDIKYIGVNDHQVDLFEGQYVVPNGMARLVPATCFRRASSGGG